MGQQNKLDAIRVIRGKLIEIKDYAEEVSKKMGRLHP